MAGPVIGEMNIVLSANAASYSAALDEAQRKLNQLKGASQSAGHATVTSVQAASAALREMNGDFTNNIRAVERFVTTIPGVGSALKAAFPVVGGLAFLAMLGEMAKKIYEFNKQMGEVPKKISEGFRDLHLSAQTANDELRITNDRLQNEIDKLQGKPQNNLALALDEARLHADKLAASLDSDMKKVRELLKENAVSRLAEPFSGQGSTAVVAGTVKYYRSAMADASYALADAQHRNDQVGAAKAQQELTNAERAYTGWINDQIKMRTGTERVFSGYNGKGQEEYQERPYALGNGKQDANLAILRGDRQLLYDRQDQAAEEKRNDVLAPKAAQLRATHGEDDKAARERMRKLETQLAELEQAGNMSEKSIYDFWDGNKGAFRKGTEQYLQVMEKMAALAKSGAERAARSIAEYRAGNRIEAMDMLTGHKEPKKDDSFEMLQRGQEEMRKWSNEFARTRDVQAGEESEVEASRARLLANLEEIRINASVGHSITELDAARSLATQHQRAYAAEASRLLEERRRIEQATYYDKPEDREKALAENQRKQDTLDASRAEQAARDQASVTMPDTTAMTGVRDAIDRFTDSVTDLASIAGQFTTSLMGNFNSTLLKTLTEPRGQRGHVFSSFGKETFTNLSGSALQYGEGRLASMFKFGKGKPTGAPGDPLHVTIEGMSSASGAFGAVTSTVNAAAGTGSLSMLGKVLGSGFIPGYANGGMISPGTLALVGERGPELAYFGSGAHITPNEELASFGGAGGDVNVHVDARGAMSPAMVSAQARQAAIEGARHGRALAAQDQADRERRTLGGKRK